MKKNNHVIVVGAGTSGMMAAIQAARSGAQVTLLEKNSQAGRKLILTGGGRCNVTNNCDRQSLIEHIPGNGKFLYSALDQFDQEAIKAFFLKQGVPLKEEDHGRVFPVTDNARTIRDCLFNCLELYKVDIRYQASVNEILLDDQGHLAGVALEKGEQINGQALVLATGGMAYPKTGSTGDGYRLAQSVGHTCTEFYATEVPLLSSDPFIEDKSLQGLALRDVKVTLWKKAGKAIVSHLMDMIFTHFGYSGPAILRCSGHVNLHLRRSGEKTAHLSIDLTPHISKNDLMQACQDQRDKKLENLLKQWMPERLISVLLDRCQINPDQAFKHLVHHDQNNLLEMIKAFPITVYGSQPIEKGFVTGGGINLKEVNPSTMESKLLPGLYFCGELLDINGYTGGFNITAAFSTGAVAGQHAGEQVL